MASARREQWRPPFEKFDDTAWDYGDDLFEAWKKTLYDNDLYYEVARKVMKHHMGRALELCAPQRGGFNVSYHVRMTEGPGAMIRFPMPAYFQYAEEKLVAEVATLRCISENTTTPVPFTLHYGTRDESPGGLGPFISMDWVENTGGLGDVLNKPGLSKKGVAMPNPDIDEQKLARAYSQIAGILVQLAACEFLTIGSLNFPDGNDENALAVLSRPLSINMSQLANFARVPHFHLPPRSKTYRTSSDVRVLRCLRRHAFTTAIFPAQPGHRIR